MWQHEQRHRTVLVGRVTPFLSATVIHGVLARVCRTWRRWIAAITVHPPPRRTMAPAEIDALCVQLRRDLTLTWSDGTERYIRSSLATLPVLAGEADLPRVHARIERLLTRGFLAPKTNIGTLDTTRVIERLTQARLSRFHTTGASSMQQAGNLEPWGGVSGAPLPVHPPALPPPHPPSDGAPDTPLHAPNLLHPMQSTRCPQMVVYLDPERVDVHRCEAVMDHVRGALLNTTVSSFQAAPARSFVDEDVGALPGPLRLRLRARGLAGRVTGLTIPLDDDALVWHNFTVAEIVERVAAANPETLVLPGPGRTWSLNVFVRRLGVLRSAGVPAAPATPLPTLGELLQHAWPNLADILCAGSGSVHTQFRIPTVSKRAADELVAWARACLLLGPEGGEAGETSAAADASMTVTPQTLRDTRRRHRSVDSGVDAPPRQRRRGVRRWAPAFVAAPDLPGPSLPAPPEGAVQLLTWFVRSVSYVLQHGPRSAPAPAEWDRWVGLPGAELVQAALCNPLLRSLLHHTVQVARQLPAHSSLLGCMIGEYQDTWSSGTRDFGSGRQSQTHACHACMCADILPIFTFLAAVSGPEAITEERRSAPCSVCRSSPTMHPKKSRNETLGWLYTSAAWHVLGTELAHCYVNHLLGPQVLGTRIGGIVGVSDVIVHREASGGEWYVSTFGSNFLALYDLPLAGRRRLCINRRRCQSTNLQEVLACLGLEAVCWLFSNGSLARSLGVNGAACRLLVDHMASRGLWRGVNRTSILSGSGTLNGRGPLSPFGLLPTDPGDPTSRWRTPPVGPGWHCFLFSPPVACQPGPGPKHLRHASFLGVMDGARGSSASVLTGGRVTFGTAGFSMLLDLHS